MVFVIHDAMALEWQQPTGERGRRVAVHGATATWWWSQGCGFAFCRAVANRPASRWSVEVGTGGSGSFLGVLSAVWEYEDNTKIIQIGALTRRRNPQSARARAASPA